MELPASLTLRWLIYVGKPQPCLTLSYTYRPRAHVLPFKGQRNLDPITYLEGLCWPLDIWKCVSILKIYVLLCTRCKYIVLKGGEIVQRNFEFENSIDSELLSHLVKVCNDLWNSNPVKAWKVHKIEIFFGLDFEICIISLLVMSKY